MPRFWSRLAWFLGWGGETAGQRAPAVLPPKPRTPRPGARAALSLRLDDLERTLAGMPVIHSVPVVFAISLKGRAVARDWPRVEENLRMTLNSILHNSHPQFQVVVAGTERPDLAELEDPRVRWLPVTVAPPRAPKYFPADKRFKRRAIGAYLRSVSFSGYLMACDADDWIHHRFVEYLHKLPLPRAVVFESGVMYNAATRECWIRETGFFRGCGTSSCFFVTPDDLPRKASARISAQSPFGWSLESHATIDRLLLKQQQEVYRAELPLVTWVLSNGENASVEMGKKHLLVSASNYRAEPLAFDPRCAAHFVTGAAPPAGAS